MTSTPHLNLDDEAPVESPAKAQAVQATPPPEAIGQGADEKAAALQRGARRPKPAAQRVATPKAAAHGSTGPATLSDESAEAHVLACCFLDEGPSLDRASTSLTADSFYHPQHAIIFRQLCALRADQKPITPDTLLTERAAALAGVNPMLLVQLTDPSKYPTTAHAGYMIARVADLAAKRAIQRRLKDGLEQIERGADLADLPAQLQALSPQQSPTSLPSHLDARRVRFAAPPPEPQTRLFLAGKPIATPGNLVTIIAKSKTGKTASLGAAVAAILGAHYDRHDLDTFKFTSPHTTEAVILLDTEQSPFDAWTCHKRTMERAGSPAEPEWLHHYALVGDSAKMLRDCLPVALERGRAVHGGVFALIVDGVADFVASVNDEAECNDFVAYLRKLAVEFNTPIICVIHSNEGLKTGDDGRGHLGKQLTRKAESNLLLKKAGDITTITSEKQRKAPITESDQVAFQWSEEHGRHISCDPDDLPGKAKGGRPQTHTFHTFDAIWPRSPEKALTKNQLLNYAKDEEDVSESTLRKIIKAAVMNGQLVKTTSPIGAKYHRPI